MNTFVGASQLKVIVAGKEKIAVCLFSQCLSFVRYICAGLSSSLHGIYLPSQDCPAGPDIIGKERKSEKDTQT